ncbi:MAG: MerR family transcriptional regulator [Planctomycetota bacterium]|jgi:DNA-binding transcriptional MerR regulator
MASPRDDSTEPAREQAGKAPSLSIGALAAATGVSPDTIRVWERRYGRPVPVRLPSGHRRYTEEHVRWMRRVTEALSCGHRVAVVLRANEQELDGLLPRPGTDAMEFEPRRLLDLARDYRAGELLVALDAAWRQLGPRGFLEQRIAPLLTGAGGAWADGHLDVRHEHFLSEMVEDTLRSLRLSLQRTDVGPLIVLATLEGEAHHLGVQMAALLAASNGAQTCVLGRGAPREEIVATAREIGAAGVAIGVSLATAGVRNDRALADLRRQLPRHVRLAVGGNGARGSRRGPRGVDYLDGAHFGAFEAWLDSLA